MPHSRPHSPICFVFVSSIQYPMYFVVLLLEFGFFKDTVSPICSMYEIFTGTYIWRKFMVNLGKYSKDVADGIVPNVH